MERDGQAQQVEIGSYPLMGETESDAVPEAAWPPPLARTMCLALYKTLYKMHQVALRGWRKTALDSASRLLTRSTEPRLKLHRAIRGRRCTFRPAP